MTNRDAYYALTVAAEGVSSTAYYSVTPTSDLAFSQGGATIVPTSTGATMVSVYPQTLQISAPAGAVNGGVTIVTSASVISGRLMVSPPVNVAVTVTLYGNGGQQLGQAVLDPGTESRTFSFPVSSSDALTEGGAADLIKKLVTNK
jgi:hypothetical protein